MKRISNQEVTKKEAEQFYDSNWYDSLDELLNAIDWEWMEDAHGFN